MSLLRRAGVALAAHRGPQAGADGASPPSGED